jgi:hypothetical protein
MQNQSVKKQSQSEPGTKENLNRLEWTVPTLAA